MRGIRQLGRADSNFISFGIKDGFKLLFENFSVGNATCHVVSGCNQLHTYLFSTIVKAQPSYSQGKKDLA
jgi:hypothetical protein